MPGNNIAKANDTGAITKTLVMIETTIPIKATETIIKVFSFILLKKIINLIFISKISHCGYFLFSEFSNHGRDENGRKNSTDTILKDKF